MVSESNVSVPEPATSKMRNVGVPLAVERVMVAPLPATVTLPVITGRPVPPSVELFAAFRVYTQPAARVMVAPPGVPLAELIAAIRSELVQAMDAAAARWGAEIRKRPTKPRVGRASC